MKRKMNEVILRGKLRDITSSHVINGTEYDQANIITKRHDDKEDIISLKFKKYSNTYKDGDFVELTGNLRSYSQKLDDNKNKVSLYVFTYFDRPENIQDATEEIDCNKVVLEGRICKIDELRTTLSGKPNIHFIIANNIISDDQKLNNYIPTVAWGKLANYISKLSVSTKVIAIGEIHSRTYKKKLNEQEIELRTAHELVVNSIEVLQ